MSCPDLQTGWISIGDLLWNGTGWEYSGYPSGGISLHPSGGWEIGFVPTQVQITVETAENWFADSPYLYLWGNGEYGTEFFYECIVNPVPSSQQVAGTHVITFDLTDPLFLTGQFMDIKSFIFFFGLGDGPSPERSFTITDITFTPCPGSGCTAFWKNLVGQREIEP